MHFSELFLYFATFVMVFKERASMGVYYLGPLTTGLRPLCLCSAYSEDHLFPKHMLHCMSVFNSIISALYPNTV